MRAVVQVMGLAGAVGRMAAATSIAPYPVPSQGAARWEGRGFPWHSGAAICPKKKPADRWDLRAF